MQWILRKSDRRRSEPGEPCQCGLRRGHADGANFREANLTSTGFNLANLTGADLCRHEPRQCVLLLCHSDGRRLHRAEVRGANFDNESYYGGTGITLAQLYSTASYQAHDLTRINLSDNYLTGGNFAGQNLTNAAYGARLTGPTSAKRTSPMRASCATLAAPTSAKRTSPMRTSMMPR